MRKSVVNNSPLGGNQDQNRWSIGVQVVVKF